MDQDTNAIAHHICETENIIELLIFIHQEGEPAERLRLNGAILTLLHAADHRVKSIEEKLLGKAA